MSKLHSMPLTTAAGRTRMRWASAALLLLAAGIFLLGNGRVSLWDRDEPRYAQCSREMLQSGNWVVPTLLGQWRAAKPPLIYWAEATAMRVLGDGPFAARFPSVVAMLLLLAILAVAIYRAIGPARAMASVFVLATSVLILYDAKQCLTDSVLLLWITIAQLCLLAIYLGNRSLGVVIIMWAAQGLAALTKGPIGLAVSLATMLALLAMDYSRPHPGRWWRNTRPLLGAIILTATCGPWLLMVHSRAPGFLRQMFGVFGAHVAGVTEQHGGPPGYHLVMIWGTFLPWSFFLPVTLWIAWRHRQLPVVRFSLAAVLGTWILVECVRTKLPHYMLPAFPPLAFLTGDALIRCIRGQYRPLRHDAYRIATVAFVLILIALGVAPWLLALRKLGLRPQPWGAMMIWSVAATTMAFYMGSLLWAGQLRSAAAVMGLGTVTLVAILYGLYLPNAAFLRLPERIGDCLKREGATHPRDAIMIQYQEDSVPYYQGGTLRPEEDAFFRKHPDPAHWPKWVVATDDIWLHTAPSVRAQYEVVQSFHGLNYAGSVAGEHLIDIMVLRKRNIPDAPATGP